jgi:peptidoglycan/LPS O-acetylase OafA/YrhL
VEEQFYLIYPLLLSLLVRRPMGEARRWVIGASVLSLLGGWAWGMADSTGAFFCCPRASGS